MDEQKLIDIEVKATEAWFKSPRFRLTKRPYTAQDGNIQTNDSQWFLSVELFH